MSSDSHEQTPPPAEAETAAAGDGGVTDAKAAQASAPQPRRSGPASAAASPKPAGAAKKTTSPARDGNKPVVIPPKAKPPTTTPRKAGVASSARPSGSAVAEPPGGAARQPRKAGARKALPTPPAPPADSASAAPARSKAAAQPAAEPATPSQTPPAKATSSAAVKPPPPPAPVAPRLAVPPAPPSVAVPADEPKKGRLRRSLDKATSSAKGVLGVGQGKKAAPDAAAGGEGVMIAGQSAVGLEPGGVAPTKKPRQAGAGIPAPAGLPGASSSAAVTGPVSLVGLDGETVAAPGVIATPQTKPTPVALGIKKMGRGPRKARVQISWVSPLSVMKVSFLLSIAIGIAMVVAVYVVWKGLNDHEVFVKINNQFAQIVGDNVAKQLNLLQYVEHDKVMSWATVLAVVNTFVLTALGTIGGFLYNILAALVGGIHVTFTENK